MRPAEKLTLFLYAAWSLLFGSLSLASDSLVSRRVHLYYTMKDSPHIAQMIRGTISLSPPDEAPGERELAEFFNEDFAQYQKNLKAEMLEKGFSEEDASLIADGRATPEAFAEQQNLNEVAFLNSKQIAAIQNATSLNQLEEALAAVIPSCNKWTQEHTRIQVNKTYYCPEDLSCAASAGRIQQVIFQSARILGIPAPSVFQKIQGFSSQKKGREDLRNMWKAIHRSVLKNSEEQETGKLAIFSFLEPEVIPGMVVRQIVKASDELSKDEMNPHIRTYTQEQMNKIADVLRAIAKDGNDPQLFNSAVELGESFAWCEKLHSKGESRIPFLMRKEILYAVLGFEKEEVECTNAPRSSLAVNSSNSRALVLRGLRELGMKHLVGKQSELLAPIWKDVPDEIRTRLEKVFESQARSVARDAVVNEVQLKNAVSSAAFEKASQKILNYYLAGDTKLKTQNVRDRSSDFETSEDPDLRLSHKKRGESVPVPEGFRIISTQLQKGQSGSAIIEYTLPDGAKRTVSVKVKGQQGFYEVDTDGK